MKKMIFLVTGVIYASLITSYATAQRATNISYPVPAIVNTTSSVEGGKPGLNKAIDLVDKTALKEMKANLRAARANLKVTNNFNKNFKNAQDVKWSFEEKAIIATFKMDEKSTRVVYNKKGNWVYTIITYSEDQMPQNIRSLVKAQYSEFSISLVQEISQGDITLHKVYLEDSTRLKQILVYNDEITVYEEFTKSK